jgi:site-specific DNA-methyltransferase (adenine-specific)
VNYDYAEGPGWELRSGRWQDVLADVTCDALVTDAPYSERTHAGHDAATGTLNDNSCRKSLNYHFWTDLDVARFVLHWSARTMGWIVSLTDHVLFGSWERHFWSVGRYPFSPVSCVIPGSRVRQLGDGPAQWSTLASVARPRTAEFAKWGALDGAYVQPPGQPREQLVTGGKPLWLMRALIRDYTRPGDLVCDPCAGGGTTLHAAVMEGRRAIGGEADPENFEIARQRLERGYTPPLFVDSRPAHVPMAQTSMCDL